MPSKKKKKKKEEEEKEEKKKIHNTTERIGSRYKLIKLLVYNVTMVLVVL